MELGLLCEAQIFLCVLGKTDKMTVYTSDNITMPMIQEYLNDPKVLKENLTNNDVNLYFKFKYNLIFAEKSKKKKLTETSSGMNQNLENEEEPFKLKMENSFQDKLLLSMIFKIIKKF